MSFRPILFKVIGKGDEALSATGMREEAEIGTCDGQIQIGTCGGQSPATRSIATVTGVTVTRAIATRANATRAIATRVTKSPVARHVSAPDQRASAETVHTSSRMEEAATYMCVYIYGLFLANVYTKTRLLALSASAMAIEGRAFAHAGFWSKGARAGARKHAMLT